jgi:hypothetical protein
MLQLPYTDDSVRRLACVRWEASSCVMGPQRHGLPYRAKTGATAECRPGMRPCGSGWPEPDAVGRSRLGFARGPGQAGTATSSRMATASRVTYCSLDGTSTTQSSSGPATVVRLRQSARTEAARAGANAPDSPRRSWSLHLQSPRLWHVHANRPEQTSEWPPEPSAMCRQRHRLAGVAGGHRL